MADLDDDAIVVTLPADDDSAVITKIEDGGTHKVAAEDPIADLKGQFDSLRNTHQTVVQRLSSTEQQLASKDQEIAKIRGEVTDSQLDTVLSGIQAAEAEATAAEQAFIAAAEAGDFAAQARAQRKMSAAESRIQRLTEAKGDLEETKAAKPVQKTEARQEPRREPADRVEQFAQSMSPRSAAWIRSHPDCVTDSKKNARMLAAHNLAVADDIAIDSDEYFQRIEAGVADRHAAKVEPKTEAKVEGGKRPMSAAASGSGSGGGMNGGGRSVPLTGREALAATDGTLIWNYDDPSGKNKFKKGDVIGIQEMARRKEQGMKDGRYDRSFTES